MRCLSLDNATSETREIPATRLCRAASQLWPVGSRARPCPSITAVAYGLWGRGRAPAPPSQLWPVESRARPCSPSPPLLIGTANDFGWGAALAAQAVPGGLGFCSALGRGAAWVAIRSRHLHSSGHTGTDVAVHPGTVGDVAILLDAAGQRILVVDASSWHVDVVAGIGHSTTS